MRAEMRVALLLFAIATIIDRFIESPVACFIVGMCTGVGLLLSIISWLPEKIYDKLLYKKLATVGNKCC